MDLFKFKLYFFVTAYLLFLFYWKYSLFGSLGCTYLLFLITSGWKYTYIVLRTLPRDMR